MHIKSVIIHGFKSYKDRTKVDLSPECNVVVGRNGSGAPKPARPSLPARAKGFGEDPKPRVVSRVKAGAGGEGGSPHVAARARCRASHGEPVPRCGTQARATSLRPSASCWAISSRRCAPRSARLSCTCVPTLPRPPFAPARTGMPQGGAPSSLLLSRLLWIGVTGSFGIVVTSVLPRGAQEGTSLAVMSAYVELVFDNSDQRLPVRIPRRASRRELLVLLTAARVPSQIDKAEYTKLPA